MRHPEGSLLATTTNRLRTKATDHLLAAGRAVGARRFVAQSFGAFRWARSGGAVQSESDPLDREPPASLRVPLTGILHVEQAVPAITWGDGLVLRYGGFYGPGTSVSRAPDAVLASALGAKPPRRIPRWLGRLVAGEAATLMMTEARGASNAKAKRELSWQPCYGTWRLGFAQGLG
ncbi:MAG TPA: hypothetical protein VMD59_16325 [Acidimicrobiales bacterium]|nr:hypothetical protein [Acidimicrobiales bacterium]